MNQLSEQTPTVAIDQEENNAPRQAFFSAAIWLTPPITRQRAFRLIKNRLRLPRSRNCSMN